MPISQETVLSLYGELRDLADLGEKLERLMRQPDLITPRKLQQANVNKAALELALAVQRRADLALNTILGQDDALQANPLTGRLE